MSILWVGRGPGYFALIFVICDFMFPQPGFHIFHGGSRYLQFVAFIVISTVITEVIVKKRRLATHRMQANVERHAFADSCPDGFLMMGTDLKIEFANQVVTKMFGLLSMKS